MTEEISEQLLKPVKAPEIPRADWKTLFIIQRHGKYDNRTPIDYDNPTKEEKNTLGRLTPEGKTEAAHCAAERIQAVLEGDQSNTYVLVVNSPTFWLDHPDLGKRAQETAEIVSEQVLAQFKKQGLSQDHLLNFSTRFKGELTRPDERLRESDMFDYEEYVDYLREKYQGQGPDFWENRNRDTDREVRVKFGAPGPNEDAKEISASVGIAKQFAAKFHHDHSDSRLVIWDVTHGDGLEPFAQRALHIPETAFLANYNEAITIAIENSGREIARTGEQSYPVELPDRTATKKLMNRRTEL